MDAFTISIPQKKQTKKLPGVVKMPTKYIGK